jgi:hypothetical protein
MQRIIYIFFPSYWRGVKDGFVAEVRKGSRSSLFLLGCCAGFAAGVALTYLLTYLTM